MTDRIITIIGVILVLIWVLILIINEDNMNAKQKCRYTLLGAGMMLFATIIAAAISPLKAHDGNFDFITCHGLTVTSGSEAKIDIITAPTMVIFRGTGPKEKTGFNLTLREDSADLNLWQDNGSSILINTTENFADLQIGGPVGGYSSIGADHKGKAFLFLEGTRHTRTLEAD